MLNLVTLSNHVVALNWAIEAILLVRSGDGLLVTSRLSHMLMSTAVENLMLTERFNFFYM